MYMSIWLTPKRVPDWVPDIVLPAALGEERTEFRKQYRLLGFGFVKYVYTWLYTSVYYIVFLAFD